MNDRDADSTHFCHASPVFSNVQFWTVPAIVMDSRTVILFPVGISNV